MVKVPTDSLHLRLWRKARGMTLTEVAKLVGRDNSAVSRWERGQVAISHDMLVRYAGAVNVPTPALYDRPDGTVKPERPAPKLPSGRRLAIDPTASSAPLKPETAELPVYKSEPGPDGNMIVTFTTIETITPPSLLSNVANAFGLYVIDKDMSPAFEPGDMILIHPTRPATAGSDVLITERTKDDRHRAYIRRLTETDANSYHLLRLNPEYTETKRRNADNLTIQVIAVRYTHGS